MSHSIINPWCLGKNKNYNELIKEGKIVKTKNGQPRRCGKTGYMLDKPSFIGEYVMIHEISSKVLDTYKKDKIWYITYTQDELNKITEPWDKAMKNKNIFKNAVIQVMLFLNKVKDLLEQLIEELNHFMREDFLKRPEVIAENQKIFKKFKRQRYGILASNQMNDEQKIYYILNTSNLRGDVKMTYKKLLLHLHPDHSNKSNASELTEYLVNIYKMNFNK